MAKPEPRGSMWQLYDEMRLELRQVMKVV